MKSSEILIKMVIVLCVLYVFYMKFFLRSYHSVMIEDEILWILPWVVLTSLIIAWFVEVDLFLAIKQEQVSKYCWQAFSILCMLWIALWLGRPISYGGTNPECSKVKDLVGQLTSSAALYKAEQGHWPKGFTDYVQATGKAPVSPKTIDIGRYDGTVENTNQTTIILNARTKLKYYNARYSFNGGGIVGEFKKVRRDAPDCFF